MCVDMVATLHASCMTSVSTLYMSGDRCILFTVIVHTGWKDSTDGSGHVDVVRVLIEAHADIHSQDKV